MNSLWIRSQIMIRAFGYNTPDGLFEEDCVQSLDQVINEKLGMGHDAKQKMG